jgi:hypothetical protein
MKAKFLFVLAAVAMLFTACNKDKEEIKAGNNELVYHGTIYKMNCNVCYGPMEDMEDAYMIDGVQADGNLFSFIADAKISTVNHTYDLTQDGNYYFFVAAEETSPVPGLSIEECDFKSGTVTITKDDTAFVYEVNAVLKDDTHFSAKIYQEVNTIENCW